MADKNYEPEIQLETPFPGEPQPIALADQPTPAGTFTPSQTKEKTFPKKRIATELLSTALNTRSRKILEKFDLEQRGAMQIGDFKEGVSGDLRITPNGLTARDLAGLTTFAIDGTTGDAVFKGNVQAGAFISGAVQVGDQDILIDGATKRMVFYADDGKAAIVIGEV